MWWLAPDKYKEHEGSIGKTSQRCQADHDDTLNIEHEHWVFYGLWWDEDVFMVPPHSLSQGDRLLWRRWSCWPADRSRAEICHKRGLCIDRHHDHYHHDHQPQFKQQRTETDEIWHKMGLLCFSTALSFIVMIINLLIINIIFNTRGPKWMEYVIKGTSVFQQRYHSSSWSSTSI